MKWVAVCFHCQGIGACFCGIPELASKREPAGGCYVILCGDCDAKIYSRTLECICPQCGAWLKLTWPIDWTAPAPAKVVQK